jgi:hypothetical protein
MLPGASARAERKQQFFPKALVDLVEVQRGLALVALDLEHGRAAFFGYFHTRIVQMHDVHLQRFHEKILVVPTAGARQCHTRLLFGRQQVLLNSIVGDAIWGRHIKSIRGPLVPVEFTRNPQTDDVSNLVTAIQAMGAFHLDELQLDDCRLRGVYPGHAAAGHRLERQQRKAGSA